MDDNPRKRTCLDTKANLARCVIVSADAGSAHSQNAAVKRSHETSVTALRKTVRINSTVYRATAPQLVYLCKTEQRQKRNV